MTNEEGRKPYCPSCGKPATGNFCQHCGSKLGGRFCNQCGEKLADGAQFCNHCGTKVSAGGGRAGGGGGARGGGARGGGGGARAGGGGGAGGAGRPASTERREAAAAAFGGQNLPWWIAGAAMFVLIAYVGTGMLRNEGPSLPPGQTAPAGGVGAASGPSAVDLNSMTPIQAADRLFNRVMEAASQGDSLQAQQFMPMALGAYERARPLTADGLFHLSLLQLTGGMLAEALASAQEILASNPDHLLALSAAGEIAVAMGRTEEAATYYQHIVEVYDEQMANPLQEYRDHDRTVAPLKTNAEAFLAGR